MITCIGIPCWDAGIVFSVSPSPDKYKKKNRFGKNAFINPIICDGIRYHAENIEKLEKKMDSSEKTQHMFLSLAKTRDNGAAKGFDGD